MSVMMPATLQTEIATIMSDGNDVVLLDLVATNGLPLPAVTAGAHIDVYLSDDIVRQYSLCGDPADRTHYRLAVRRNEQGRGGSRAVHVLKKGQQLKVGLPRNHFGLEESAAHSLLLAGGIGITPLVAMAHRLYGIGASFELHYRTQPERAALARAIEATPWAQRARFHFDRNGFDLEDILSGAPADTHAYVCGPRGFLEAAQKVAASLAGLTLHAESFAPSAPTEAGAFRVQTASDGKWHNVPAERTILEVLTEAGYAIPTSCEQGICGTCRTTVLDGVPDHRDLCLSNAEHASGRYITPCCSRAHSDRLVLDL